MRFLGDYNIFNTEPSIEFSGSIRDTEYTRPFQYSGNSLGVRSIVGFKRFSFRVRC